MAKTNLLDRVRAATTEKPATPVIRPAQVVEGATAEELHAAEQAEGGQAADIVMAWLEQYKDHFTNALPSHVDAETFLAAARAALPGLSRCTPASLLQAFLACASSGLLPDGRHAVVTAEGRIAVFIPMAQGYLDKMYRSGRVASVHIGLIHEKDEWNYEPSAPAPLDFTFRPALRVPKAERGPATHAYAFCWMTSGARSQVVILSREDAQEIRDEYSKAYRRAEESGAADSFWHTDFDRMWEKSCLRRLHKVVPMSAELVALAKVDDAGDAGQVQVVDPLPEESPQLVAEAEEAHERAEDSQDPMEARPGKPVLLRKASLQKRTQPKRTTRLARKSGKGSRR
ncbi:recombinase RecT [Streptomyces vinaceus]|uniref:recombinase RecT n=1 Tax=Streptomyces vinaceus TaxID=1960 RepID=UPI0036C804E4